MAFKSTVVAFGGSVRYSENGWLREHEGITPQKWGRAPRKKATMPDPFVPPRTSHTDSTPGVPTASTNPTNYSASVYWLL